MKCNPRPRDDLLYGLFVAALIAFVLAVILERTQIGGPASALSATAVAAQQAAPSASSDAPAQPTPRTQ
jgi:hypothetical protein